MFVSLPLYSNFQARNSIIIPIFIHECNLFSTNTCWRRFQHEEISTMVCIKTEPRGETPHPCLATQAGFQKQAGFQRLLPHFNPQLWDYQSPSLHEETISAGKTQSWMPGRAALNHCRVVWCPQIPRSISKTLKMCTVVSHIVPHWWTPLPASVSHTPTVLPEAFFPLPSCFQGFPHTNSRLQILVSSEH